MNLSILNRARHIFIFGLILLLQNTPLISEIERVTITWRTLNCQNNCPSLLDQQFRKINGIAEFSINAPAGVAFLKWKPNVPFSYSAIDIAMRMVGLSFTDIRLRVTGTLQYSRNTVTLTSAGDNTRFNLLNPVVPDLTGQATEFNVDARSLTTGLFQNLVDGATKRMVATVEGPLFMPWRDPSQLVVEQLSFTQPKD